MESTNSSTLDNFQGINESSFSTFEGLYICTFLMLSYINCYQFLCCFLDSKSFIVVYPAVIKVLLLETMQNYLSLNM